jgi:hypothetical protein
LKKFPVERYRNTNGVTVTLPDFNDDIAFRMTPVGGTISTLIPALTNTDTVAGKWSGAIKNTTVTFSTPVILLIQAGCARGKNCGTFSAPKLKYAEVRYLESINTATFLFQERNVTSGSTCQSGSYELLQLLRDGTLSYQYLPSPGLPTMLTGILKHP